MAIFHFAAQVISRSDAGNAVAAAADYWPAGAAAKRRRALAAIAARMLPRGAGGCLIVSKMRR